MSYQQVSRQRGSQAQIGASVVVTLDDRDRCKQAKIVIICVGETPVVAHEASKLLVGQKADDNLFKKAGETAANKEIDPGTDIHATAEYRKSVAAVLIQRALSEAFASALKRGG
jgi:aerobic carbon-monoxide dehydrogenase medium subunit